MMKLNEIFSQLPYVLRSADGSIPIEGVYGPEALRLVLDAIEGINPSSGVPTRGELLTWFARRLALAMNAAKACDAEAVRIGYEEAAAFERAFWTEARLAVFDENTRVRLTKIRELDAAGHAHEQQIGRPVWHQLDLILGRSDSNAAEEVKDAHKAERKTSYAAELARKRSAFARIIASADLHEDDRAAMLDRVAHAEERLENYGYPVHVERLTRLMTWTVQGLGLMEKKTSVKTAGGAKDVRNLKEAATELQRHPDGFVADADELAWREGAECFQALAKDPGASITAGDEVGGRIFAFSPLSGGNRLFIDIGDSDPLQREAAARLALDAFGLDPTADAAFVTRRDAGHAAIGDAHLFLYPIANGAYTLAAVINEVQGYGLPYVRVIYADLETAKRVLGEWTTGPSKDDAEEDLSPAERRAAFRTVTPAHPKAGMSFFRNLEAHFFCRYAVVAAHREFRAECRAALDARLAAKAPPREGP